MLRYKDLLSAAHRISPRDSLYYKSELLSSESHFVIELKFQIEVVGVRRTDMVIAEGFALVLTTLNFA